MNGLISSCRLLTPDLWLNKKPLKRAAFLFKSFQN
jgi:hypothetical protein